MPLIVTSYDLSTVAFVCASVCVTRVCVSVCVFACERLNAYETGYKLLNKVFLFICQIPNKSSEFFSTVCDEKKSIYLKRVAESHGNVPLFCKGSNCHLELSLLAETTQSLKKLITIRGKSSKSSSNTSSYQKRLQ